LETFDTDAAWMRLKDNLKKKPTTIIPITRPDRSIYDQWWKAAAAVILMIGVGIYLFRGSDSAVQRVEVVAEKTAMGDTLPDGSNVFLNKKTKVVYAYDKKKNTHDVKLKGEAYFSIKHNEKESFVIDAGDVFIKDIGTSFNVKAYPGSDLVEVLVEEGEIIFYTADNPGIRLKESGKAVYNKKTKQFSIDQPDPNITAYKTRFFVFSGTTLGEAADALNKVYDTMIIVPDHLKACPITVSFRNESVEEITAVIAETLGLTVATENGKILLNGTACE
jgi:transmembrane sensor